jgi:hypothetical protein
MAQEAKVISSEIKKTISLFNEVLKVPDHLRK